MLGSGLWVVGGGAVGVFNNAVVFFLQTVLSMHFLPSELISNRQRKFDFFFLLAVTKEVRIQKDFYFLQAACEDLFSLAVLSTSSLVKFFLEKKKG